MFEKKENMTLPAPPEPEVLFRISPNPEMPSLPSLQDTTRINVRYPLIEPYAYAHIYWDRTANELVYQVEEPPLNESEAALLETIENVIFIRDFFV